jgi:tetratricopeptide (TPR) repeat protein
MNIGDAHRAAGDLQRALAAYRGAVETAKLRPDDDPLRGDTMAYLGRALVEAERFEEARPILRESLDRLEGVEGWDDARAIARDAFAKLP